MGTAITVMAIIKVNHPTWTKLGAPFASQKLWQKTVTAANRFFLNILYPCHHWILQQLSMEEDAGVPRKEFRI